MSDRGRDDQTDDEGQVSEVGEMVPAESDTPIQQDQATAGGPDAESGGVQEGTAGPNARPHDDDPRGGEGPR